MCWVRRTSKCPRRDPKETDRTIRRRHGKPFHAAAPLRPIIHVMLSSIYPGETALWPWYFRRFLRFQLMRLTAPIAPPKPAASAMLRRTGRAVALDAIET